ncbi:MAG: hypothetical protein KGJ09_04335 [Candidatus Omnitrophica bacterium]|nr:hypothetical protein [Candidatus Omnitrophota bacterium]MDE2213809.1 hypothetical protein [Candidatus Omnitrophota bacterium]
MTEQPWYKKASVQAAIVAGISLVIVAVIPYIFQIPNLQKRIQELEGDLQAKNFEIQGLETQLAPFKTIALGRFTGTESEALSKLAFQLNNLESAVSDIKKYAYVSTLGVNGSTNDNTGVIILTTPISLIMQDALNTNKLTHQVTFKCDDASIARYKKVIDLYPNFPFSYYGLAVCLSNHNNPIVGEYLKQAWQILKVTTTIDGHHPAHDEVLKNIEKSFADAGVELK